MLSRMIGTAQLQSPLLSIPGQHYKHRGDVIKQKMVSKILIKDILYLAPQGRVWGAFVCFNSNLCSALVTAVM